MKTRKLAVAAAFLTALAVGAPAHAGLIDVNGHTYDVKAVYGTFASNASLLQSQVWWGDAGLARDFAEAFANTYALTPLFAYANVGPWGYKTLSIAGIDIGRADFEYKVKTYTYWTKAYYAVATKVSEPGMFALFGLGLAGIAFARRRTRTA